LTDLQFNRNDFDLHRGTYRVQGDTVEIVLASEDTIVRLKFFGDEVEEMERLHMITGETIEPLKQVKIFPAKHFVTPEDKMHQAMDKIRSELAERLKQLRNEGKVLEAARLEQRTNFDLEMLSNTGFVSGIENYSRHMDGRLAGDPPSTLIDYFPDDFLLFIDESHQTIPQIGAMYEGDRSRKTTLIDYGFRLPSALDNRPLKFEEFDRKVNQVIYVSATPAAYEIRKSLQENILITDKKQKIVSEDLRGITIVEQINRPTGLLDPTIEIQPIKHQVDHLLEQIRMRVQNKERVLVTTLSKRMAEELTEYIKEAGIKAQYLHSEVETFERLEILRDLRLGVFDVIIGINLLREGLDLPEVSLVAILDADKEGFLRSETSFMQIMGRAARHINGHVIMYADRMTKSMEAAIGETKRRRQIQEAFNHQHGITPQTIQKKIAESRLAGSKEALPGDGSAGNNVDVTKLDKDELKYYVAELTDQMDLAAKNMEFELAAQLRDRISEINKIRKLKK
jgi:excinuclease ABC subunit B